MKSKKKRYFSILLSLALALTMMPALGQTAYAKPSPVKYLDAYGKEKTCEDFTYVTAKTNLFENGKWYVVGDELKTDDHIVVEGAAHLILMNGKSLTVGNGIEVRHGKELNIYAQSLDEDAGSLTVTGALNSAGIGAGYGDSGGTITINGGKITAKARGNQAAGIGGGQAGSGGYSTTCTVTINGGNVTANGSSGGAGIGGGSDGAGANVTINGGIVTASSGNSSIVGIGCGGTNSSTLSQGDLTLGEGVVMQVSDNNTNWSDYDGTNRARYMKTIPVTEYPLWIGGTQVTEVNASDVFDDGKVSYSPETDTSPAKLSLNGYNYESDEKAIYAEGDLIIETKGANSVANTSTEYPSRTVEVSGRLIFQGSGTLDVIGGNRSIIALDVTVESGTVNTSGGEHGIYAIYREPGITINGGVVNASGEASGLRTLGDVIIKKGTVAVKASEIIYGAIDAMNVIIEGGNVEATGAGGITAKKRVTINGGVVKATGIYVGIAGEENVTINSGTTEATATADGSRGIDCSVVTINEGSKVVAKGNGSAISGNVINHIAGTGWTDTEGKNDKTKIEINTEGQDLSAYKKVQFPELIDKVTVKFDSAGGSAVKEQTINKGAKATKPADPKKSGYTFDGWYNGKTGFDFNTAVNENITLTAHWKENVKPTPAPTTKPTKKPTPKPTTPKRTTKPTAKPAPAKVSGMPMAKLTAKGKTSLVIGWNKIQGAVGYDIFFSQCKGKKSTCKKIKTIKGNKTFELTRSGLKKGTSYKAYVKAYVLKNGKKTYVRTSPIMHAYTGNGTKNYTNARSLTVNKTKVTLKKGKAFKVKSKVVKVKKDRKLMSKKHVETVRYMTSNKKVATVSPSGRIIAKGKGNCTVVAFAHNGISKTIKVTVK